LFQRNEAGRSHGAERLKHRAALVVLAGLFLWASLPGRSPSFPEEALLTPVALLAGLPAVLSGGTHMGLPPPSPATRAAWRELLRFEKASTRPPLPGPSIKADVLDRAGRGGAGWKDLLLLSLPMGAGGTRPGDPCLVGGVLVGYLDQGPPPGRKRNPLLAFFSSSRPERPPGLAWVRLLHSRNFPGPEPLRLEVRLSPLPSKGEPFLPSGEGIRAILGPGRPDDAFPLRLFHPASLTKPAPGLGVFSWSAAPPWQRTPKGALVGTVARDPWMPEIRFVAPWLPPEGIHCVHILPSGNDRPGGTDTRAEPGSPLARGRVLPAPVSPFPGPGLRERSLLLSAGTRRGVRVGAAAVLGWSFVGKVVSAGPFHCRVARPGDQALVLRVLVTRGNSPGKVVRLFRGRLLPPLGRRAPFRWVPDRPGTRLARGDKVWTAPEGLDMPKGLLVGTVDRILSGPGPEGLVLRAPPGTAGIPRYVGIFRFEPGRGGGR